MGGYNFFLLQLVPKIVYIHTYIYLDESKEMVKLFFENNRKFLQEIGKSIYRGHNVLL